MSHIKADSVLDVKGEGCPYPLLKTTKKVAEIDSGKILEVISNDPMSSDNISAWAKDHGHEVLTITKTDEDFQIFLKKK
ncbi:MAG: sulfurtransferase TusA family protein [Candidatus Bathyarchaeota archaeon]